MLDLTFSVLACPVAVGDAAKNHSNPAQIVCRKKAAQISLVQVLQLEDILWTLPCLLIHHHFLTLQNSKLYQSEIGYILHQFLELNGL